MRTVFAAVVAGLGLSACAYNAPVSVSPNLNVYSSYAEKLPGSYTLYVSSDGHSRTVKPTGLNCRSHNYPLTLEDVFKQSTIRTIQQLVQNVEVVDSPLSGEALDRAGKTGQIMVRADTMTARIQFIPGFWSSTADANVSLSANLAVDGAEGRLLGTTAEGFGNAQGDAGQACGGGANALGEATEKAMRQLFGQLGERLSNSPRLRRATTP